MLIQIYAKTKFKKGTERLHRFGKSKFANGGSVLGSSQFSIQPQLPSKLCSIQKWSKLTQK
jgi:hypothetical protein